MSTWLRKGGQDFVTIIFLNLYFTRKSPEKKTHFSHGIISIQLKHESSTLGKTICHQSRRSNICNMRCQNGTLGDPPSDLHKFWFESINKSALLCPRDHSHWMPRKRSTNKAAQCCFSVQGIDEIICYGDGSCYCTVTCSEVWLASRARLLSVRNCLSWEWTWDLRILGKYWKSGCWSLVICCWTADSPAFGRSSFTYLGNRLCLEAWIKKIWATGSAVKSPAGIRRWRSRSPNQVGIYQTWCFDPNPGNILLELYI